ncbi:MAG: translation initiation factor IF-2 subunit beta [Candidatus Aenigmatarchaeota archaeon]
MEDYYDLLEKAFEKVRGGKDGTRFKIPEIKISIIKNKTIIENFLEIVTILRRSKEDLLKFFSKELGAAATLNSTKLIINKIVKKEVLDEKLKKFIEEYVLCKHCKSPDTKIENKKIVCEACGASYVLV